MTLREKPAFLVFAIPPVGVAVVAGDGGDISRKLLAAMASQPAGNSISRTSTS